MSKFFFAITFLLLTALPVFAQDSSDVFAPLRPAVERLQNIRLTQAENLEQKATEIEARREALQLQKQQITDERRLQWIERFDTRINNINKKVTAAMAQVVSRMQALADKLATRLARFAEAGQDVAAAEAALATANQAIADADAAVVAQSEKDYVLEFTDESELRAAAQALKLALRTDLQALKEIVQTARRALVAALEEAHEIQI
jgi:hypothetical protein